MRSKESYVLLALLLFNTLIFVVSNEKWGGSLKSVKSLATELRSKEVNLFEWQLSADPPFKYRLLFSTLVKTTSHLISSHNSKVFFKVYYVFSLLFFLTTVISLYFLLKVLDFPLLWRTIGSASLAIFPAYSLAFTVPVHTREDMLGYTILCIGLIALYKRSFIFVLLLSILGVLTRETLLILPFVYFFYSDSAWLKKVIVVFIPISILIVLRMQDQSAGYDLWLGIKWNLTNIPQVLAFIYITFHIFWLFFALACIAPTNNNKIVLIRKSAPAVALLIISTTLLFGIANEIRLFFLLFPWTLTLSVDFIRHNLPSIVRNLKEFKRYITYVTVCVILFAILTYVAVNNYELYITRSKYPVPYELWIVVILLIILLSVISVPVIYKTGLKTLNQNVEKQ